MLTLKQRMERNLMKMDMALWERDAAENGIEEADRRARAFHQQVQRIRARARLRRLAQERLARLEICCYDDGERAADWPLYVTG